MMEQVPLQTYSFSTTDRAFYRGAEVRLVETLAHGFLVKDMLDENVHTTIEFDQIPALLKAKKLRVDRGYYSKPGVKLRAQDKLELPFDIESSKRADLSFKFGLIMEWRRYFRSLPAETVNKAEVAYQAVYGPYVLSHLKQDIPSKLAKGKQVPFSTAMQWNRRLAAFDDDARCLIDGRKGNCAFKLDRIVEGLLQQELEKFLTRDGPIQARLVDSLTGKINEINENRRAEGRDDLLPIPSHRTIGRRIQAIDKWMVEAARKGPDEADKAHRITMDGVPSTRPGERIEVDGWVCDLHTLLGKTDAWMELPSEIRAQLKTVRVTIIVAIDTVTRCIAGISFSWSENGDAVSTCLRMAMEDKTEIAKAFGCESAWPMHGWNRWIHDMHNVYGVAEVRAAVLRCLGTDQHTPAGIPWLRGRIERFFRTMATKLISFFRGQTGSDPKKRTVYQQQQYATVTYEELVGLVIQWVVDVYHRRGHKGLGGLSPMQAWYHFSLQAPPAIGLNPTQLLTLLGRCVELPADGAGIEIAGSHYNSLPLQRLLRKNGFGKVTVKVDELDLGQILVRIPKKFLKDKDFNGEAWIEVPAPKELVGISYRRLEIADQDMAIRYGYDAVTSEKISREAIKAIEGAAREAARARLTEPPLNLGKLKERMQRTFHPALQFQAEQFGTKLAVLHSPIALPGARHALPTPVAPSDAGSLPFTFKD